MPNLDRFAQGLPDPQEQPFMPPCDICGNYIYTDLESYDDTADGGYVHTSCEAQRREEEEEQEAGGESEESAPTNADESEGSRTIAICNFCGEELDLDRESGYIITDPETKERVHIHRSCFVQHAEIVLQAEQF